MGLPLFIAPVESDIKTRSDKAATADPVSRARSTIRRPRRTEDREARALRRRAAILRTQYPTPGPELSGRADALPWTATGDSEPAAPEQPARYPWIESGELPPPEAYQPEPIIGSWASQRPAHASSRLNWERIASLFPEWDQEDGAASPPRGTDARSEYRSHITLPEIIADANSARSRSYRRSRIDPSVAARFDRSPERPSRSLTATNSQRRSSAGRIRASRPGLVDGLGDRNRSLSPEVWDTLLTTLTPDPQPPSAGSSFASTTAPTSSFTSMTQGRSLAQTETTSAQTSFTDLAEGDNCDTGDMSASEEGGQPDDTSLAPLNRVVLNVPSRHRRFVSALDSNTLSSMSYVRADADRPTLLFHGRPDGTRETTQRRFRQHPQSMRRVQAIRRPDVETASDSQSSAAPPTHENSADSGSLDTNDPDVRGMDEATWAGMQRIVRGLVERRDIPDEWWAEAGLSRVMSGDP